MEQKSYSNYNSLVYILDRPLEIACSAYVNPLFYPSGKLYQDYNDLSVDTESFSLNVFSTPENCIVHMCWLKHTRLSTFFNEFKTIPENKLPDFLVQWVLAYSENHAFQPSWWKNLSLLKQRRLTRVFTEDLRDPQNLANPVQLFRYLGFTDARIARVVRVE